MVGGGSLAAAYHTRRIEMSKRRLMILGVVLLLSAVYLAQAGLALAVPPERRTIETTGTFVVAECDGFDVINEHSGQLTITEFYSQNGELERLMMKQSGHSRLYNTVTGSSVSHSFTANQTYSSGTGQAGRIIALQYNPASSYSPALLCEAMDQ
jgi:hypothetical protein